MAITPSLCACWSRSEAPQAPISRRFARLSAPSTSPMMTTEEATLKKEIADFYDGATGMWEKLWGDHMHHGFYEPNSASSSANHRLAQIRMIEECLRFAGYSDEEEKKPKRVVDVGCGMGGSSRYLAKKYGATCVGIALSPLEVQRAQALSASQGLGDKVSFQVADALDQPFPDGQFDLVWAMESAEHMTDKKKFVSELARVAAPGGTIMMVTSCHRNVSPSEPLNPEEKALLNKMSGDQYLTEWCSPADYVKLFESLPLQDIKMADWSEYVSPFWPAAIRSLLTFKGLTSLLLSGWKAITGMFLLPLMVRGNKMGLLKYVIITCRKPE